MSSEAAVFDSNVLIDLLKGHSPARETIRRTGTLISFITEIELMAWPKFTALDMELMSALISQSHVVPYDPSIKAATIQLRRTTKLNYLTVSLLQQPLFQKCH